MASNMTSQTLDAIGSVAGGDGKWRSDDLNGVTGNGTIPTSSVSSVTKDAITWTFDTNYEVGQFVNGDYFVVDPGTGVNFTGRTNPNGADRDGAMLNPVSGSQGYDTYLGSNPAANYGISYSSALNVLEGASVGSPVNIGAGVAGVNSLVSVLSVPAQAQRPAIQDCSVLTIVDTAPPAGSFRPCYTDATKTFYNESNIDYTKLANVTSSSSAPSMASIEDDVKRVWLDHYNNNIGRTLHPSNNMPDYGADLDLQMSQAWLMANTNLSNAAKRDLVVYLIQQGIDFYGLYEDGQTWPANGGHAGGRKLPIIAAGVLLGASEMSGVGTTAGSANNIWGETSQCFTVTQSEIDACDSGSWNPEPAGSALHYESPHIGLPEWGIRRGQTVYRINRNWNATYRTTVGSGYACTALVVRLMGIETEWNDTDFMYYTDRYVEIEGIEGGNIAYQPSTWAQNMWNDHRASLGSVWSRNDSGDLYSLGTVS